MQCRYCLGTDEEDTMVAPCDCRGTSQFTHQACLQRYFVYFPDRVCRVCNTRMEYASMTERLLPCLFVPVLSTLVMLSSISPPAKALLLLGGLGLSVVFATNPIFHKDLAIGSAVLGCLLMMSHSDPRGMMWILGGVSTLAWFRTVLHYVPAHVFLLFMTCTILLIYVTLFAMAMIQYLDALGTAVFVVQLFLYWQSVLHLRPGQPGNRIHNE